jgi:hypothetical protein
MENSMDYDLREEVPSVSDYINTRLKAGLSRKSEEAATIGLSNSIYSVVVFFNHEPMGVGILIMKALFDYLHSNAPSTAYISLMADHGTPHFYEKFGFTLSEMPKSSGIFMRIK